MEKARGVAHALTRSPQRRTAAGLVALIGLFVVLAGYYSFVTPIFETPDEVWHYAYIRQLVLNRALPVVDAEGKEPYRHEGLQPPLYYALGSAVVAWMDASDLSLPEPNPFARIGEPRAASNDNRNAFLHPDDRANPLRGAALAVHLLRLYSILLGAGTVLLTWLLAHEVLDLPIVAWGAAILVALLPQFLFISGAISNDNLATPLAVATLLILARITRRGLTVRRAGILGGLIGAALLTKLNTIALAPLALLVLLYVALRTRDLVLPAKSGAIVAGIAAAIAGWWYLRNVLLYGDPTTFQRLAVLVGQRSNPMSLWRWIGAENEGLRLSLWGVFGWFDILASPAFYQFYDALAILGLIGLAVALAKRRHLSAAVAILPLWGVLIFVALWKYASEIVTSQGRLLFPALPAWAVLWSWGLMTLIPARWRGGMLAALTGVLALVAASVPTLVIAPAYAPAVVADATLPGNAVPLAWHFDNGVEWLGVAVDRQDVFPGDTVRVTVYARVPAGEAPRTALYVHLVNAAGVIVAQRDSLLASGNLAPHPAPIVIADAYDVSIPIGAPSPGEWQVEAGMYDPAGGTRIPARDASGLEINAARIATLHATPAPAALWNLDFDGRVTLTSLQFDRQAVAPGGKLALTLNWRNRTAGEYHVFAHALGDNERAWAGADAPLTSGTTELELTFDPQTPPGVYPLEVGVYPAPDGDRLEVYDRRGQDVGDRLFVGPIRVTGR